MVINIIDNFIDADIIDELKTIDKQVASFKDMNQICNDIKIN